MLFPNDYGKHSEIMTQTTLVAMLGITVARQARQSSGSERSGSPRFPPWAVSFLSSTRRHAEDSG